MILESVDSSVKTDEFWKNLGQDLASLHKKKGALFGFEEDNYIGMATQKNGTSDSWADFFWDRRLHFKINEIENKRQWSLELEKKDQLKKSCLKILQNRNCHPSPLHGDLWSGNILCTKEQLVFFIDPAFYFGDREADLAMTECFGGFSPLFYKTYKEYYPPDEGYEIRKHLYNLYHILNHLLIFGDQYKNSVENLINTIISMEP